MADLRNRTGSGVALSGAAEVDRIWEPDTTICGKSPRGFEFSCTGANVQLYMSGLNNSGLSPSADPVFEILVAGAAPIQRFCFRGDEGTFIKIYAMLTTGAATLSWAPCVN